MAQEIKNTFLKSKMNKDLDDRILPNGEYRDARNISVGRSEDNDVGALENIIGNNLVTGTDIGNGLTIIGIKANNSTDEIFVFLTDYTDPSPQDITSAPLGSLHYIYSYNNITGAYTRLVQGNFLNFSKTNRIIGINLVENLLFWTDNRNQPRKINISLAGNPVNNKTYSPSPDYYTQEHQISVAKYNPYKAIELYNRLNVEIAGGTLGYLTLDGDRVDEITPYIGSTVVSAENTITGNNYITITSVALQGSQTRIFISPDFVTLPIPDTYYSFINSTMTNKNDDPEWPGDPDYLEDRFVRFSYRFKYDDNEYSLAAPFTQIAYIPKQKGYFISGDEDAAYQSTVIDFMKNNVQNIGLVIPLPTSANRITSDYKIKEVEILFKESSNTLIKVLESVTASKIAGISGIENYYAYDYQSRKPYKTLPEAQSVRVYDKVPVRAFAQESAGNRIIYGNYIDQYTPPTNLNYNCRISHKSVTGSSNNFIEYPNSSVKRNRNYQIGFVLADKFGRQSPVILSSVDNGTNFGGYFYSGSTIYSPYDISEFDTNVKTWRGDAIVLILNSPISSTINTALGTPGLYAIEQQNTSSGIGFAIKAGGINITNTTYTFRLDNDPVTGYPNNVNLPQIGDSMRGYYEDFVYVSNITGPTGVNQAYTVTTSGRVSDVYNRTENLGVGVPDIKFAYIINDLGWYSYKIVVKQTQQEYYNVYLPGILNGYPGQSGNSVADVAGGIDNGIFPANETNKTAFTVLFNDNINKVPRDLLQVGPDQTQYRSSVELYGVVTNVQIQVGEGVLFPSGDTYPIYGPYNAPYFARITSEGKAAVDHLSTAIAKASDFNMAYADLSGFDQNTFTGGKNGNLVFYQIDTDPLIARISTLEKPIGVTDAVGASGNEGEDTLNMLPYLAVYETAPVESLLDIYWETSSEGLIVDLNADVASTSGGAVGFVDVVWEFRENTVTNEYVTTGGYFWPIDAQGNIFLSPTQGVLVSVTNGDGVVIPDAFELLVEPSGPNQGGYRIKFTGGESFVYTEDDGRTSVFTFEIAVTTDDGAGITSTLFIGGEREGVGAMKNIQPYFDTISPIEKTTNDTILIPIEAWANSENGTGSTVVGANKEGLEYTMTGDGLPPSWVMDINSGEMVQDSSGIVPGGTYNVTVRLTDASGVSVPQSGNDPYIPLYREQSIQITIGYPHLNSQAISPCILNVVLGETASVLYPLANAQPDPVSGIWYIAARDLDFENNFEDNGIIYDPNDFSQPTDTTTFRLNEGAEAAHTSGTIAFSVNAQMKETDNPSFTFKTVRFYYRYADDQTLRPWLELQREQEYNRAGLLNSGVRSRQFDTPFYFTTPGSADWSVQNDGGIEKPYAQSTRCFNYNTFANSPIPPDNGVEYAIVMTDLKLVVSSDPRDPENMPAAWVVSDDLHYPGCVPWRGINFVQQNDDLGTAGVYKYNRSDPGITAGEFKVIGDDVLYAETPYGEYVELFFIDQEFTTPYTPLEGTPYINFQLDLDGLNMGLYKWTTATGGVRNLQWCAKFDHLTGVREQNGDIYSGVNAVLTTDVELGLDPNLDAGTFRIKTDA
jgi:hypothetical protein